MEMTFQVINKKMKIKEQYYRKDNYSEYQVLY